MSYYSPMIRPVSSQRGLKKLTLSQRMTRLRNYIERVTAILEKKELDVASARALLEKRESELCLLKQYKEEAEQMLDQAAALPATSPRKKDPMVEFTEKVVVRLRTKGMTFEEIGEVLGVSRQRVHQILTRVESQTNKMESAVSADSTNSES